MSWPSNCGRREWLNLIRRKFGLLVLMTRDANERIVINIEIHSHEIFRL